MLSGVLPQSVMPPGLPGTGFQVKSVLDDILEKIPETFNMAEIMAKAAEKTPYVVVAFQECERMNILTNEMRRSLKELNLGLKVKTPNALQGMGTGLVHEAGLQRGSSHTAHSGLQSCVLQYRPERLAIACWSREMAPCWHLRHTAEVSPPC